MTMFSNLNQVVLNEILMNLQEGNITFMTTTEQKMPSKS